MPQEQYFPLGQLEEVGAKWRRRSFWTGFGALLPTYDPPPRVGALGRGFGGRPWVAARPQNRTSPSTTTYSMLRNNGSGQDIGLPGRILAGLLPGKHRNWPSGRPEGRFQCVPGNSPATVFG